MNGQCEDLTGGTDTCLDITTCAGACGDNAACVQSCLAAGTPAAQQKFQAQTACTSGCTTYDCYLTNGCADQVVECQVETFGTSGCLDLQTCAQDCAGNETCSQACFGATSKVGLVANLEIGWCVRNYCAEGDTACTQQVFSAECSSYVAACQANL